MKNKGFTLIELLIVLGVVAILATLAFVSLNPLSRFQDSRNTQRASDAAAILSAIKLDQVDNGGLLHANLADLQVNRYYQIGEHVTGCDTTCSNPSVALQPNCVDLLFLIDEGYLADIPYDPNGPGVTREKTGYYIYIYDSGQIAVGACNEEKGSNSEIPSIEAAR